MSFKDLFENKGFNYTIIQLKDKIDEKVFSDILVREGLTKISIEIKNSEKSIVYNCFKFEENFSIIDISSDSIALNSIALDSENSCIYTNYSYITDGYVKKILFKEKILDEVYDRAEEYKNNPKKYEANTDDIIEKIEEGNTEPYYLFIIKHFIKYIMDKYKEENPSSEDNSTNKNIEDTKNVSKNPFIED